MVFARHYVLQAKPGKAAALLKSLREMERGVKNLPGCKQVMIMSDISKEDRFIFIEIWNSKDAYAAAGKLLSKAGVAAVGDCAKSPIEIMALEVLEGDADRISSSLA